LGEMVNGQPVIGRLGLANSLARLAANFAILKPQLGLNNPSTETDRFSLRLEYYRNLYTNNAGTPDNSQWVNQILQKAIVTNLWDVPEFVRYCRPFAPRSAGAQPGIVL